MMQIQFFISNTGKVQCGRLTVQFETIMGSVGGRRVLTTYGQTEVVAGPGAVLYR